MEKNANLAIKGEGFFVVESFDRSERYYTRKGDFRLTEEGILITKCGKYVLDKDFVPLLWTNKKDTKRFAIALFTNVDKLVRVGNGMYTSNEEPTYTSNPEIVHLMQEKSETDLAIEFIKLFEKQNEIVKKSKNIIPLN